MIEKDQQRRQLLVILLIVFLGFLGISMPYVIFPALFLNPEYSILPSAWTEGGRALFLGVVLAVYPLGQFIGSPILGALSDQYGRKHILSASLLLAAICNLFTGIAIQRHYLGLLIISRLVAGLMEGNVAIARAIAADLKTISKHKAFGKINAVTSIAYLIGPFIGGLLTDKSLWEPLTTSTPFFFICFLFLGLAILATLVLKKSTLTLSTQASRFWQRVNFFKRIPTLFANKQLKFLLLASTLFTLAVDIFYEFGPVYLTVKWILGPPQLIFYNGALCLTLAIGNGWLPNFFSASTSTRLAIMGSMGSFAIFLIGIALANSVFAMMTLFSLCGLAIGLAVTLLTVKISNSVSDTIQGEVMGIQISLRVLGDGVICLFGSLLLTISPKLILLIAAILSILAMLYYRIRDRARVKTS